MICVKTETLKWCASFYWRLPRTKWFFLLSKSMFGNSLPGLWLLDALICCWTAGVSGLSLALLFLLNQAVFVEYGVFFRYIKFLRVTIRGIFPQSDWADKFTATLLTLSFQLFPFILCWKIFGRFGKYEKRIFKSENWTNKLWIIIIY